MSPIEKTCYEFEMHRDKQSVEEILNGRAVKRTIQILYDQGLVANYKNTDDVLKDFL